MNREDLLRELAEIGDQYIEEAADEISVEAGKLVKEVSSSGEKSPAEEKRPVAEGRLAVKENEVAERRKRQEKHFRYGGAVAAGIAAAVVIGILPALRERPRATAVAEYSAAGEALPEKAGEISGSPGAAAGGAVFEAAVGNPWLEVTTMEEAEMLAGFTLAIPEELSLEYPQQRISVIAEDCIELCFLDENSVESFCIRKGRGSGDVSGDYTAYSTVRERRAGDRSVTVKGEGDRIFTAVWTDGDYAFAIFSERAVFTEEEILNLASRIL